MINKHETIYQELTPDEIRELYGLQIDEDLEKYVRHINLQSKGKKIKIVYKKGGEKNAWGIHEFKWSAAIIRNAEIRIYCTTSHSSFGRI